MSRRVTHKCSTLHQCHTYQSRVNITESYYSNVVLVLLQQFLPHVSQISCWFIFQQDNAQCTDTWHSQLSWP